MPLNCYRMGIAALLPVALLVATGWPARANDSFTPNPAKHKELPESARYTTPECGFSLFRSKLATRHRDHHGVQLGADFRHTCLEP